MSSSVANASFTEDQLRDIVDFDAAVKAVESRGGTVANIADELGDGFSKVEDKDLLVGIPFMILDFRFNESEYGDQYVTVSCMTKANEKLIFNDGSSGVRDQLFNLKDRPNRTFLVPHGLRKSQYDICADCLRPHPTTRDVCSHCTSSNNERKSGSTFYIDTSA